MIWHDLRDPKDPELDHLAARYHLHPLHIEDCRNGRQRAKIEEGDDYLFIVLKPLEVDKESCEVRIAELDIFLGSDYVITFNETACPTVNILFDQIRERGPVDRADQLFYRIFDLLVDSYNAIIDGYSDEIDKIEDDVLEATTPELLQRIFRIKRSLIEIRRIMSNTRDVAGHLQRTETPLIQRDLFPFLRDVYDHLARNMDMIETHRDLLTGAMDIYLSSVANRTNQVMKVLTVLGTIALPSIVISGFFGMNTKDLPWTQTPHGTWYPLGLMLLSTGILLWILRKFGWL